MLQIDSGADGEANNNDDSSGSFDDELEKFVAKKPSSPQETKKNYARELLSPRPMSSSPTSRLQKGGERMGSQLQGNSSPVDLAAAKDAAAFVIIPKNKKAMNPPALPLSGSDEQGRRRSTSPVSFTDDIEAMEKEVYGSGAKDDSDTEMLSDRDSITSSPTLSIQTRDEKSRSTSSLRSAGNMSSSSDSDSDEGPGGGFTFSLGNLEKLTISMSNLDKLIVKTPRNSARGGFSAREAEIEEEGEEELAEHFEEGGGGIDVNPHLMLQQWMMFPTGEVQDKQSHTEKKSKTRKEKAEGKGKEEDTEEVEEEIIVEETSRSSGGRSREHSTRGSPMEQGAWSESYASSKSDRGCSDGSDNSGSESIRSSDSEWETDTDYEPSDEDREQVKKMKAKVEQVQVEKNHISPPPGPLASKRAGAEKVNIKAKGTTPPPPTTPSPKKLRKEHKVQRLQHQQRELQQQEEGNAAPRSLLKAARSKIANPKLVHGSGIKKFDGAGGATRA